MKKKAVFFFTDDTMWRSFVRLEKKNKNKKKSKPTGRGARQNVQYMKKAESFEQERNGRWNWCLDFLFLF